MDCNFVEKSNKNFITICCSILAHGQPAAFTSVKDVDTAQKLSLSYNRVYDAETVKLLTYKMSAALLLLQSRI